MTQPDNPFVPANNQFVPGEGDSTGTEPTSAPDGGITTGPAPAAETTKPRQLPSGGGMPGAGAAPGFSQMPSPAPASGGSTFSRMPGPASGGGSDSSFSRVPMGSNTPQPRSDARSAFRRAVAIRNEIRRDNPHLTDAQAFFLAKQAVGLQVTAAPPDRDRFGGFDPRNFNDPRNPRSPLHPNYGRPGSPGGPQSQQGSDYGGWGTNPVGPTVGPNAGYSNRDNPYAQRARQMGYRGESPITVGMGAALVEHLWNRYRNRAKNSAPSDTTQPTGDEHAVTTPQPDRPDTIPDGPPTPHPHPASPQPGEPSVPEVRRRAPRAPRPPRTPAPQPPVQDPVRNPTSPHQQRGTGDPVADRVERGLGQPQRRRPGPPSHYSARTYVAAAVYDTEG